MPCGPYGLNPSVSWNLAEIDTACLQCSQELRARDGKQPASCSELVTQEMMTGQEPHLLVNEDPPFLHCMRVIICPPFPVRYLFFLSALLTVRAFAAVELTVDFFQTNGVIRPLHGVNMGPLCYRGMVDLSAYHRELGVPFTRLHDVVWVNAEAVDIHTIFRDFRNDPALPESYDFRQTDDYVQSIINVGSQIVYRLGESIEHTPRKYHVQPPADLEKWAAICIGIIRHYNEGWAGGFHHNIRYWEIWNEPDVRPAMWTGTEEQYLHLYAIT